MANVSDRAFGKRAGISDTQRSGTDLPDFPARIEKNIGPPLSILGAVLIFPMLQVLPLLSQPAAMPDALLHSNGIIVAGSTLVVTILLYILGRNPSALEITAQGISLTTRSGQWFYNWRDIEAADQIKGGVRLRLKGRSDEQNQYNVISTRFGLNSTQLSSLITAGISQFGAAGLPSPARTTAPGDDLQGANARARKTLLFVLGFIGIGMFAFVSVLTLPDCLRVLDLQKNGRATQASVVRLYETDCGKRGCSIYAEYTFAAPSSEGAPRQYKGYASIGNSRQLNDPNLVYVRTYRVMPIAFDIKQPSISKPNFNNRVFTEQPFQIFFQILGIVAAIEGIVAVGFLLSARKILFGPKTEE